ncbi:MAG: hypothetical protein K6G88_04525 [Lachnospiraceae bacterium]|nr:hypothetical protein [Lachnospiraceae bacterium]
MKKNVNGKKIAGYLLIGCMSVSALTGCGTKSKVNNTSAKNETITTEQETETETRTEKESDFAFEAETESGAYIEGMCITLDSSLDDISISWDKVDGTSYYRLYRVDMSKVKKDELGNYEEIDKKLYEKLGDIEENKYVDKDVKPGNNYYYYVEAVSNEAGNEKVLMYSNCYDSIGGFERCCGLTKPEIGAEGYEEGGGGDLSFHDGKQNIMVINFGDGTYPDGYIVYRKAEGEKEFKKIDEISDEESDEEIGYSDYYCDTKVEYKKKYTYKFKSYKVKNGEKIYSQESDELTLIPTKNGGTYKVSLEGNSKNGREGFEFSIKSDKDNCDTVFYKNGGYFDKTPLIMSKYSTDNKNWKNIPKEGVVLKEEEKLYFKFEPTDKATVDKFEDQIEIKGLDEKPWGLTFTSSYGGGDAFHYKAQYVADYEYLELGFKNGTGEMEIEWE